MKKNLWLLLPGALVPYWVLGILALVYFGGELWEIFNNNIYSLLALFGVYLLVSLALSIVYGVRVLRGKISCKAAAKAAMVIKLAQIPAFVAIFLLGVLFFIAIWTIFFTLALVFFDGVSLVLSGIPCGAAVIAAAKKDLLTPGESGMLGAAQFFFCADVIAAVILYKKLAKR